MNRWFVKVAICPEASQAGRLMLTLASKLHTNKDIREFFENILAKKANGTLMKGAGSIVRLVQAEELQDFHLPRRYIAKQPTLRKHRTDRLQLLPPVSACNLITRKRFYRAKKFKDWCIAWLRETKS